MTSFSKNENISEDNDAQNFFWDNPTNPALNAILELVISQNIDPNDFIEGNTLIFLSRELTVM